MVYNWVHHVGVVKYLKTTDYGNAATVAYKIRVGTKYQIYMFTEVVPIQLNIGAGDTVDILVHPEVYAMECLDTNAVIKKYGYRR